MKAGSQRILCADDNLYVRNFVSRILTSIECDVTEAATAGEALSRVRERPDHYDLLIIADSLPDLDSVELSRRLRSIPYRGQIEVTASKLSPDRLAAYEALGASASLVTPVGDSDLLRLLEPIREAGNGKHRWAIRR